MAKKSNNKQVTNYVTGLVDAAKDLLDDLTSTRLVSGNRRIHHMVRAQVCAYWRKLDAQSDRMVVQEIGKTSEGRPHLMAIVTSPENHQNLEKYRDISRRLRPEPPPDPRIVRFAPAVAAFGEAGRHVRVAVGVAALPSNSAVEVDLFGQVNADSLNGKLMAGVVQVMAIAAIAVVASIALAAVVYRRRE